MKIYPINQSPVMFRGNSNNNHSTIKRYLEPRTGAYYYYDTVQFENNNSNKNQNVFKTLVKKVSNAYSSFTRNINSNDNTDDILWL